MLMFPDLYAFVIRLYPERGGPAPEALGHQVQAIFLELVRQIDPELANTLHADALSKPFTAAPLGVVPQRNAATLDLRITLLHTDLFAPFTRALLEQTTYPALRLGTTALTIKDVLGTPGAGIQQWAGYTTYADLAATAQALSHITLTFATPTVFGQSTLADGRKRLGLLPLPE